MTEVVTPTAAYVQPLLYAARHQAVGVPNPDSPQSDIAISLAASQQQQAADATQVAPASDDRSSLKQGNDDPGANRSFANQLPAPQPKAEAPAAPAPTTGPAKARVDIPVFDITAFVAKPAAASAPLASAQLAETPEPAPKPLTFSSLAGGPAGPAAQPVEAAPRPQFSGVLGPAAEVKAADLDDIAANIFGAAFAPTQVIQPTVDPSPAQTQKNFIFAQRKLFADDDVSQQASGKFVPADVKAAALGYGPDAGTGKFAVQPAAVAAATAGAQFAASADTAQKLFDKVPVATSGTHTDATGEVRLYDKVPQTDTQNQSGDHGGSDSEESSLDSRQSLYQRAQAVAQALGEKSSNPAVKKLVATLESYALVAGITPSSHTSVRPTVRVIV